MKTAIPSSTDSAASAPSARFDAATSTVHAVVEIAAPPERVFRALTDPRELGQWWGADEPYRSHDWKLDLRPGGRWSTRTTSARGEFAIRGEYITVDPPHLLEYTWRAEFDGFNATTVRCELSPVVVQGVAGTRLRLSHSGIGGREDAPQSYTAGWVLTFEWLSAHLAARSR